MKKNLLTLYDLSRAEFDEILERSERLKHLTREGVDYTPLRGKTLGMIFDKSSTRTRLSFEVGMYQLGGIATFLSRRDIQLGRGETIKDTAQVMSRYLSAVMIRTFAQEWVDEFARWATIPVINGLTDLLHPCQVLGDLFTIVEKKGTYKGLNIAYVGDGNNIANSWVNAATKLPFRLNLACPDGYDPDDTILRRGMVEAPGSIRMFRTPAEAVTEADVVYTDVWASMGQEGEKEERARVFQEFQINEALVRRAKNDVIVMHCLPAHRGEEITDGVIDGPHSVVLDQAENRLHVQKAIMEILIGERKQDE